MVVEIKMSEVDFFPPKLITISAHLFETQRYINVNIVYFILVRHLITYQKTTKKLWKNDLVSLNFKRKSVSETLLELKTFRINSIFLSLFLHFDELLHLMINLSSPYGHVAKWLKWFLSACETQVQISLWFTDQWGDFLMFTDCGGEPNPEHLWIGSGSKNGT